MTWYADCTDCEFVEAAEDFGDVYDPAREHEDETGHDVDGRRVQ